jgi:hypothetical protein
MKLLIAADTHLLNLNRIGSGKAGTLKPIFKARYFLVSAMKPRINPSTLNPIRYEVEMATKWEMAMRVSEIPD